MWTGRRIADRFDVEAQVGEGGMGVVYCAHDRLTGRKVALKVLRAAGDDLEAGARFARESSLLAELRHPGIVRHLAHGRTAPGPEGQLWLAMQWLEGLDLAARLASEGLTLHESLRLARRVADVLAYAHGRGVIHRDLKPSNLFLVEGEIDRVRVLDFGLARRTIDPRALTRTGSSFGTPGYMAPEQALGTREVGPRSDVFSLGCILFECIAGHAPFQADDPLAVLAQVVSTDAPRLSTVRPDVPESVSDLVARMLARDTSKRFADGRAVLDALESLDVEDAPRPIRSAPPPALTEGEQRVGSAVLFVGAQASVLGPLADRFGTRLVLGPHGTLALFHGRGSATDQVVDAARFALAVASTDPEARAAIVTGRARAGGSRAEPTPFRELAEVAARVVGPEGSGIRLDDLSAGLVAGEFDVVRENGVAVLRGARSDGGRTLLGRPSPFVGRDRELRMIEGVIAECIDEGAARVVQVIGAPGLGKSRLAAELLRRVGDLEVWTCRGEAADVGAPFSTIARALHCAASIAPGDPASIKQQRLRARVDRHVQERDVDRVVEFLAEAIGAPFDDDTSVRLRAARREPPLLAEQVRRAFEDFVQAEVAGRALAIVIDDVQWSDPTSVQLVDAALRRAAQGPLFVLALARPDVEEVHPQLFAGRPGMSIALSDLGARACAALVRSALPDAKDDVVARIVERAGGNALWLEELIRAAAAGDTHGGETVLAMVQARLDALPPEARRLLRAASIFGTVFWSGGVRALLADERLEEIRATLDDLVAREAVVLRGEGRFPGEIEYAFRHALVRDAAYAMLTEDDLVLGHALAGAWLERAGETSATVLAEHFERGRVADRAARWFLRAAEQALEANDLAGVDARVSRGLACGPEGELLGALEGVRAQASRWRSDNGATLAAAEHAIAYLAPGTARWFEAVGDAAVACARLGRIDALVAWAELLRDAAVEHAGEIDPLPARLMSLCRVATELLHANRSELGGLVERIEREGEELLARDPGIAAMFAHLRAAIAMIGGDLSSALAFLQQSAEAFAHAGDLRHECLELGNVGYVQVELGLHESAEPALRDALAAAERLGLAVIQAGIRGNLSLALQRLGRVDESIEEAARAAEIARASGSLRLEGAAHLYGSMALAAAGRLDEASASADRAVAAFEPAPTLRAYALSHRAKLALDRGDVARALEDTNAAWAIVEASFAVESGEALVRLVRAEVLAAASREEEARSVLADAAQRLRTRAEALADPEVRRAFLERVPENAETLRRAEALV